jgi:hypothetical protein
MFIHGTYILIKKIQRIVTQNIHFQLKTFNLHVLQTNQILKILYMPLVLIKPLRLLIKGNL